MKPDVQKALLATAGRYIRKMFGEVEPRIKALEDQSATITKLLDRIDVLEKSIASRPLPEKGEKGDPGQDAEPVLVADVVAELLSTKALDPVLDLLATDAVAKHMEANPVRDGKDGEPGPKGDRGEKGDPGADGVGLAGAMIDRDGGLVVTLTNGEVKSLGLVVGNDGAAGKDGADFSEFDVAYDGERTITIKGRVGEIVKRLPIPLDKGYWTEGKFCERGDIVTSDGTAWIALRDTKAKPGIENKGDWRIFARKGKDGSHGRNGIDKTASVKVGADA